VVRTLEARSGPGSEGVIPGPALGRSTTASAGSEEGIKAGEATGSDPAPPAPTKQAGPNPPAPA